MTDRDKAGATLLFDLDGTLVDSLSDLTTAVNLLRRDLDLGPLDIPAVRACVGDGVSVLVRRILPETAFSEPLLQRFLDYYSEHLLDETGLYPGIDAVLAARPPAAQAVVTNKPLALAERVLEGLGLTGRFGTVVGGDSCAEKKPHPAPVIRALDALGASPAASVMIGDHHTDLRSGSAAGMRSCFCRWGYGHDDGLPSDYLAETPADLLRHFPG